MGKYGVAQKLLSQYIDLSFRFFSTQKNHGEQFCGLFKKKLGCEGRTHVFAVTERNEMMRSFPKISDKRVSLLLKAIVSAGVLFLLFRKIDMQQFTSVLAKAQFEPLVWAYVSALLSHVVAALRWQLLCPQVNFFVLLRQVYIARFYSTIAPGQMFGEAAKIVYLTKEMKERGTNIASTQIATSVVLDKIVGLIGLVFVGIWGWLMSFDVGSDGPFLSMVILAALFVLLLVMPLFKTTSALFYAMIKWVEKHFPKLGRFTAKLEVFYQSWRCFLKQPLRVFGSFLLSIVFHLLCVAFLQQCGQAVNIYLPFYNYCYITVFVSLALLLPVSFAGLGVREATLVGFLTGLGVPVELTLGCSFLQLLIHMADALVGGLLLLVKKSKKNQ